MSHEEDMTSSHEMSNTNGMSPNEGESGMNMGMMGGHGGGSNSAAYMMVSNAGDTDDAIIKASTDVAETVELHTVINDNGVMKMRPVEKITIPANGEQRLKPGGFHVMLLGITQDLNAGDSVTLTLTLEQAGDMTITAPVSMMAPEENSVTMTEGDITVNAPWVRAAVMMPADKENRMPPSPKDGMEKPMVNEGELVEIMPTTDGN